MKKLLIAMAFAVVGNVNAQVSFKPGVKAGYSASKITGYGGDYRSNFYIGGYGLLNLSRVYSMQFEVMYLRQGVNNVNAVNNYDYNYYPQGMGQTDIPLDYLSLNFINKFSFDNFSLHVGPGLDIKVSEEEIGSYAAGGGGVYYANPVYGINSDIDLTFNIGLGYRINDNLGVEARMRQGLIEPVYLNSHTYSSHNNVNRSFMVGLTYTFK